MLRTLIVLIGLSSLFLLSSLGAQPDPAQTISAMDWNSDGSLIAYAPASSASCYDYDKDKDLTYDIQILDVATDEITKTITGTKCPIYSLDWSPDDSQIVAASLDVRGINIWDVNSGQLVMMVDQAMRGTYEARWKPDGQQIAFSSSNGVVVLMNPLTGELLDTPHYVGIALDWNTDGSLIVTGSNYQRTLNQINIGDDSFTTLLTNSVPVTAVDLDDTNSKIAFGDDDGNVQIWDTELNQLESVSITHPSYVYGLEWKPDDSQIASGSLDGTLIVWDALTGDEIYTTKLDLGIYDLAWSPDGTKLAYPNDSGGIEIIPAPEVQTILAATPSQTPIPPFPGPSLTPAAIATATKTPIPPFPGPSLTPQR